MRRFLRFPRLRRCGACLVFGAFLAAGCSRPPAAAPSAPGPGIDPGAFDGARAFQEVADFVALGLRDANTPGAAVAARHIRDRLEARGVHAGIDEFSDATPSGTGVFRNVIGRIPGNGRELVVLGAHFDTKSGVGAGFEGANDSGSGVGVLLEIARVLGGERRDGPDVWLAFFDGEECLREYGPHDGFHGSRRLAAQLAADPGPARVRAVLVADMVGDRDLGITLPSNGDPKLMAAVFAAAHAEGVRGRFSLLRTPVLDDHEPFRRGGMPAVDLIDFQYGSAPDRNDYWHTPEDRMDKLSADSLTVVGRVLLRILHESGLPSG